MHGDHHIDKYDITHRSGVPQERKKMRKRVPTIVILSTEQKRSSRVEAARRNTASNLLIQITGYCHLIPPSRESSRLIFFDA